MGLSSWLFGGSVKASGEGVKAALNGIGGLFKDVRTAITGKDPAVDAKLTEIEGQLAKAQTDINLVEARHPSIFVAGWRPFIGWICGLGLAYHFILHPLIIWFAGPDKAPALETNALISLVLALLGLGGMRSWEKKNTVDGRH